MSGVIRQGALLWDSLETSVGFNVKCGNRLVSILDQEEVYYTHQDTERSFNTQNITVVLILNLNHSHYMHIGLEPLAVPIRYVTATAVARVLRYSISKGNSS